MLGISLGLTARLNSSAFNPAVLFGLTDTGWVYDHSDFSTLFQDAAGTNPVTDVGQPVGLQLDKSGKGNHRTQSISLNRPTLLQDDGGLYYLSYDGINDSMATASFAWGTDKATVVAGVRHLGGAGYIPIVEMSASYDSNAGVFTIGHVTDAFVWGSKGTIGSLANFGVPAFTTNVLTGIGDISGDRATLRVNATQVAQSTADQGTGNFLTYPAYFGARGGTFSFFNGREYSQFAINRLLTTDELAQIEAYTAGKTGVVL